MNRDMEAVYEKGFALTDYVTEEVTTIKYTIRQFLGLLRDIFNADACYLYLVSKNMDPDEKMEILKERIEEMKEAFEKEIAKSYEGEKPLGKYADLILPKDLGEPKGEDTEILKFIDVSQKTKEDGRKYWYYDYRNRPRKYVIFTKHDNGKEIPKNEIIFNEGITAYIYRTNKPSINTKKELNNHRASASLNSKHGIKPTSAMSIGFPLSNKGRTIGVLTIEFYDQTMEYNLSENSEEFKKTLLCLPLLVQLIVTSESQFHKGSYQTLFGGMGLLDCLKKIDSPQKNFINEKIYKDTLHLFYVLERKEYVGYEEILGRVADYANDISKYLGVTSESKPFADFLEKFEKHKELSHYGLNDFRDHFMHQFHVFVSGYIIINLIGFDVFQKQIENSMKLVLGKSENQLNISNCHILRIWFLVSFFHDHAYIYEKIGDELQNFFKGSFFPTHLTKLQDFFNKQGHTNPDALMGNYLDSIIGSRDHGILSTFLFLNYFSEYRSISPECGSIKDDCLYTAFALSIHNQYEKVMEKGVKRVSFELFPMVFLLSYCDTAQSFGRIGKRQNYRSRFSDIKYLDNNRIIYELEYLDEVGEIPEFKDIENWAKQAHNTFKSSKFFFEIEYYKVKEVNDKKQKYLKNHIYTLSYGFYKDTHENVAYQSSAATPLDNLENLPSDMGRVEKAKSLKIRELMNNCFDRYYGLSEENLDKLLGWYYRKKSQDSLAELEKEISDYINESSNRFIDQFVELERDHKKVWALKYFSPAYFQSFLNSGSRLFISKSPGFTWGDGIYLTSIKNPYSSMMYGNIGVMGWIDANNIKIYDACRPKGIELYQRWISYTKGLYSYLTTTVHADWANRLLRNKFRKTFEIDIVIFHPDQYNMKYCDKKQDFWFLVSDWDPGRPAFSKRIQECKPLVIVGEKFEKVGKGRIFSDLIGKNFASCTFHFHAPPSSEGRPNLKLISDLKNFHSHNDKIIIVRP